MNAGILARRLGEGIAVSGLTGWFALTVAGHHPLRTFDRVRELSRSQIAIPDWRFFAPEPGRWDTHLLYRVQESDGTVTPWRAATAMSDRRLVHAVWFPRHRFEKSLIDVTSSFTHEVRDSLVSTDRSTAHKLLTGYIERIVRKEYTGRPLPQGMQFVVARDGGYDADVEAEFESASEFIELAPLS